MQSAAPTGGEMAPERGEDSTVECCEGRPGRRERRKQEVLARIRAAALELFCEKGYDATTVEEIAERADVAKGTFFNYFPRKDSVLLALAEDGFEALRAELGPPDAWSGTARQQFQRLYLKLAGAVEENPDLWRVMLIENMRNFWLREHEDSMEREFHAMTRTVLERARQRGEFLCPFPVEVAASLLEAAYFTTMVDWLRRGAPEGVFRRDLTAKLDIIFRGLGASGPVVEGGAK
jgi:TetR/AcrR family transcriptional regulator, cholesterol catabolism regulator